MPGAAEPALTLNVALPPALTDAGLTDTDGPAGLTLALKLTAPADPTCVVLIVLVPEPFCGSESEVGFAAMVKSGVAAVTFTVTVVACVLLPSTPVTVTV